MNRTRAKYKLQCIETVSGSDQMQQSMDVNKTEHLSVINDMRNVIRNKISSEFENRIAESNAWSNKVVEKLDATVSEIDEFLDEDVQRGVLTGATPARKEFSYPRKFTVTSPHE